MPGRERLRRQLLRGNPPPYYSLLPERDCCCAWRGYNAESTTIIHIRMTMPEEGARDCLRRPRLRVPRPGLRDPRSARPRAEGPSRTVTAGTHPTLSSSVARLPDLSIR